MKSKPVALSLYFGIPGAGKSTFAAYLAKKDMKKGRKVWSNFGITGAMKCEKSDFGKYMMTDGRLIIDEAGLEYDNRKMAMTNDEIYFFKYHRHYQLDVDFFSQGLDVDIKIRKLARHIYLIKPSLLPFFIKRKEISMCISSLTVCGLRRFPCCPTWTGQRTGKQAASTAVRTQL